MSNYRQAALYLHSLDEQDRDWIVRQLHGNKKKLMENYVRELNELGIPKDLKIGPVAQDPERGSVVDIAQNQDLSQTLSACEPAVIWEVIKNETATFIEVLLSCHSWDWSREIEVEFKKLYGRQPDITNDIPNKLKQIVIDELERNVRDAGRKDFFEKSKIKTQKKSLLSGLKGRLSWSR